MAGKPRAILPPPSENPPGKNPTLQKTGAAKTRTATPALLKPGATKTRSNTRTVKPSQRRTRPGRQENGGTCGENLREQARRKGFAEQAYRGRLAGKAHGGGQETARGKGSQRKTHGRRFTEGGGTGDGSRGRLTRKVHRTKTPGFTNNVKPGVGFPSRIPCGRCQLAKVSPLSSASMRMGFSRLTSPARMRFDRSLTT